MMLSLRRQIDQAIAEVLPEAVALRHQLHAHPELALRETATCALLREVLSNAGISLWSPLLGTDVIAELPGADPGRIVALRADIDAVEVTEMTGLPYRSTTPGVMHACGHDGHTAMLVGAALVLHHLRAHLPVTVRCIFQPGEEIACAGKDLVAAGACRDVEQVYAMHGWPGLPFGAFSSREGALFAAGNTFTITVRGEGCHAAMPWLGRNPLPAISQLIARIQSAHDALAAQRDTVMSACAVQAGSSANVIPATATIQGTARYTDLRKGEQIVDTLTAICDEVAAREGVTIDIAIETRYALPVLNTSAGVRHLRAAAPGPWIEAPQPTTAMEDFAYYLPGREGAMCWLGLGEQQPPLHNPHFDFPDDALVPGITLLCLLALGRE